MPLTELEQERYSRPLKLPGFSIAVQEKLKSSRVLIVGAGGLGIPVLQYLSSAGIGTIGVLDFDKIELSNLHRQVLYYTHDVGKFKSEIACEKARALNSEIDLREIRDRITAANAEEIISEYDLIVDCTDNFETRYLVNDACVLLQKPLVFGSIHQYEGQVSVFNILQDDGSYSANYRDILSNPPSQELVPNCEEGGLMGSLAGIIGSLMANESLKLISGLGESLGNKLLTYDSSYNDFRTFKIKKDPNNPLNSASTDFLKNFDYLNFCGLQSTDSISINEFMEMQKSTAEFQLIDVREASEYMQENMEGENIPLSLLSDNFNKIDRDLKVVVHCKAGGRSRKAIELLRTQYKFDNLLNLEGGIDAWKEHQLNSEIV